MKRFNNFNAKAILGFISMFESKKNPLFCCEKCKKYFGFFYYSVRMLSYYSMYDWDKERFQYHFIVKCRKCGYINYRIRIK